MIRGAMLDALSGIGEGLEMITMGISETINAFDGMATAITDSRIEFEKFFQSVSEAEMQETQNQIIGIGEAYGFAADQALSAGSRMAQLSGIVGEDQVAEGTELGMVFGLIGGMETEDAMKKMINLQAQTNFMMGENTKAQYDAMSVEQQRQVLWDNSIDMMDSLNSVENTSAATMNQIIQVMNQYASQAHLTGESIGNMAAQSALLIEAGEEQGKGGRALRMIYARLGSDIGGAATALNEYVSVTDEATGANKPLSQIIRELGPHWDSMTESQQQNLAQQVAGNRHYVRFIKLMENRQRLFELEENAHNKLFPAMDERNKRLLNEQFQLKLVNAELENRKTLLAEKMIPALTAMREVQIGYYEAILPLLDKEQMGLGKVTAHLFTGVIRANEMMKIFGGFYNAALNIANMVIAYQTFLAVQRSITTELSTFYQIMGRGQAFTTQNTTYELMLGLQKAKQTQRINELYSIQTANQLQIRMNQDQIVQITELELALKSDIAYLEGIGINRQQIKNHWQQDALKNGQMEVETLRQKIQVQAIEATYGQMDLAQAQQMLKERQKIIQTRGLELQQRQQELNLGVFSANAEKMTRGELLQQGALLREQGQLKGNLAHMTNAELITAMKKNEQAIINNELEKRGVNLAYEEMGAISAVMRMKQQEVNLEMMILDVIADTTQSKTVLNAVQAQKNHLTSQNIILEENNIVAMLEATGIQALQTVAQDKDAISKIRNAWAAKQAEQGNLALAQSSQQAAVGQMAMMGGLMSVTMVMGMFGDTATAMKGQMMVMVATMGYSVVAMVKMVRQMNITITTARVLSMALGGVVLGGALMLLGEVLLPSATDEIEEFAVATEYAATSVDELVEGIRKFADVSLEQMREDELAMERELFMLKDMAKDADEGAKAIIDQKISALEVELGLLARVTDMKEAQNYSDILADEDKMQRLIDFKNAREEWRTTDTGGWMGNWDANWAMMSTTLEEYIPGTEGGGNRTRWFEEQAALFDAQLALYNEGMLDLEALPEEWGETKMTNQPGWAGRAEWSLKDILTTSTYDDEWKRLMFAEYARAGGELHQSGEMGEMDQIAGEWQDVYDIIVASGAKNFDELAYYVGLAASPPDDTVDNWEETITEASRRSLTLIEEFAEKREELFYGGKLGNLTGSLYKNVIQQGVGTLYNHQEVIVSNRFHGFFNPDQAAELIVAAIDAHLAGRNVAAAISIAE